MLGLLLGAGLVSIAMAWWEPQPSRRTSSWTARWQDTIVQAGISQVTPRALVTAGVVFGAVVGLVVTAVTRAPVIALPLAAAAGLAPMTAVRSRARARQARVRNLWPDVVDHLGSGVRAGLSLPEALAQLGDRGPEELRGHFQAFAEDYRVSGRFGDCLDALKARAADPVADRIVEALRLTRDVGGSDLGLLLRTLSRFLREDARVRGEIEARQSWTVVAARVAAASPWLVLIMLSSKAEAAEAYRSPGGALVVLTGAGLTVVAYTLMKRAARLPDDPRVLR